MPSGTETVRLLACPFCGGKPEMCELGDADSFYVHCTECEVQQIANYRPREAAERWNRRSATAEDVAIEATIPAAVRWTEAGHA
jgi:Lar family restriction alleviation protein